MEEPNQEFETTPEHQSVLTADFVLTALWAKRVRILRNTILLTMVAVGFSLLLPERYTAQTTILPDVDALNLASRLGGVQDLAIAAGLNVGSTSPSQLYPEILMSEMILKNVIYHRFQTERADSLIDLMKYWDFDDDDPFLNYEDCLTQLRKDILSITVDRKTGVITLEVETPEARLSADIANKITEELEIFQRDFRRTNASEQRTFIEERMASVMNDLKSSEDYLRQFRERNRRVEHSPQLQLEQGRLMREVELNSALFIELKKQYEVVKLDEVRNTTVVQLLDKARIPSRKSWPKRSLLVVSVGFLGLVGFAGLSVLKAYIGTESLRSRFVRWQGSMNQTVKPGSSPA